MVNVTFRMDEFDKQQFERIISEIGLNLSSAFNIFAKAVIRENAIPFDLKARTLIPNDETAAVLARADDNEWETITIDDLKAERADGVF